MTETPNRPQQPFYWTDAELLYLRERYVLHGPSTISRVLNRSYRAIKGMAFSLGLKYDRVLAKKEGIKTDCMRKPWSAAQRLNHRRGIIVSWQSGRPNEEARRRKLSMVNTGKRRPGKQGSDERRRIKGLFTRRIRASVILSSDLIRIGQYINQNAQRLIMEGNEKNGIAAGNEDVMQSSDGSWLLAELQKSFDTSVKHIVRMAAIVRRLDELGVAIEMESSVLPYLRKIAHGNLSPDLFVTMQGHKSMLNIASTLPAPVQQQIAKNEPIKVMSTNGDFRMVPPLSMTTKEVSQVFAFGRIRDEAEQVGYLRGKMQEKATTDQACEEDAVKIDRKRRGIVVGKTFISFIELEHFYKALAPKKKSRQAV